MLTLIRVLWRRRQLERSCRWTSAELAAHHERRLAELRRFVRERSPFYARSHRGLDDRPLLDLPILTKATLMEHFDELVTDRRVRLADAERYLDGSGGQLFHDRYLVLSTSGSTGRRGVFLFDRDEWLAALAMITRPIAWAGVSRGLYRPPRTAMIASTMPWHYSARVSASFSSPLVSTLRIDAATPVAQIVRQLNAWQPTNLAVYPSVLKQLAEEQLGGRLTIRLSSAATSGEVLTPDIRRLARDAWGIRVFDTYGATEYAPIAAECEAGNSHLFEDEAIIEVVDEDGRAVPDGSCGDRLLLTVFNRRTQPLIRYEISDMVRLVGGTCSCGRPFRMIASIEGRIEDVLYFPNRTGGPDPVAVHPNVFHAALERAPGTGWQVRQEADGLVVSLVDVPDAAACEPLARELRHALDALGARVDRIDVRPEAALARGATGKAPLILARPR